MMYETEQLKKFASVGFFIVQAVVLALVGNYYAALLSCLLALVFFFLCKEPEWWEFHDGLTFIDKLYFNAFQHRFKKYRHTEHSSLKLKSKLVGIIMRNSDRVLERGEVPEALLQLYYGALLRADIETHPNLSPVDAEVIEHLRKLDEIFEKHNKQTYAESLKGSPKQGLAKTQIFSK